MYYLKMFGISLFLTLVIESIELLFRKEWNRKNFGLLVLVNILTNPAAVAMALICKTHFSDINGIFIEIPIEILVVLVEAFVYRMFAKLPEWDLKKPVHLAVMANLISWGLGVVVQLIR